MNWLHHMYLMKLPDSSVLPFVKAKTVATNIATRTYLKMRFKLYRCYKVACEWCFKPFLNLKDAGRCVASELCKPLAPSTLFASACLTKKQKENSNSTEDTKSQQV